MNIEEDYSCENKSPNTSVISIRNGFSERHGLSRKCTEIQVTDFDERTRIGIYNSLYEKFKYILKAPYSFFASSFFIKNFDSIFCDYVFKIILNDFIDNNDNFTWDVIFRNYLKGIITTAPYNEILDLVEKICTFLEFNLKEELRGTIFSYLNDEFEMDNVGYRFIDGIISPITNMFEIKEIEIASKNPFENCRMQIQNALRLFSNRSHKDYKNCIKEAISAVEALL